jgi:hypothetical protein
MNIHEHFYKGEAISTKDFQELFQNNTFEEVQAQIQEAMLIDYMTRLYFINDNIHNHSRNSI